MSTPTFQKATRKKAKLKLAISGPSGSGKTFSALRLACGLGKKVAFIDSENGSASLYSDRFSFDVLDIAPPYTHDKFISAIHCAGDAGYDVVVIDSASHFWEGILEFKAKLDTRAGSNSYTNWNEAGAKFKGILDAVLQSPLHVICCLRSKMDYIMETNERGKQAPKKVGLAPVMRDGIEYEFTTVFDVDMSHQAKTSKDRTGLFKDEIFQISEGTGTALLAWMESGAEHTSSPAVDGEAAGVRHAAPKASDATLTPGKTLPASIVASSQTQIGNTTPTSVLPEAEYKALAPIHYAKLRKVSESFAQAAWKQTGESWQLRVGTLSDISEAASAIDANTVTEILGANDWGTPEGIQGVRKTMIHFAKEAAEKGKK